MLLCLLLHVCSFVGRGFPPWENSRFSRGMIIKLISNSISNNSNTSNTNNNHDISNTNNNNNIIHSYNNNSNDSNDNNNDNKTYRRKKGGPKEGGLNIGRHEGLNMQRVKSKTRSNQLLLTTLIPWDPLTKYNM